MSDPAAGSNFSPSLSPALQCPACGSTLTASAEELHCTACDRRFAVDGGIPLLFWPHDLSPDAVSQEDVTEKVKAFYEETPFPNYEDFDSRERLERKARAAVFADVLDTQLAPDARVIEAGCGTGQLSNFLGLRPERRVFGTDICLNSLRLGHQFARQHAVEGVSFVQMNLFRPVFEPGTFDLVVSNGVLHHTADPFGGFRSISRLAKEGGLVVVGLYNRFGRALTNVRRTLFRVGGPQLAFLDPRLRKGGIGATKQKTWFLDQYRHPHESQHSFGEVLEWFDRCGVEFVNSIPKLEKSDNLGGVDSVLQPHSKADRATRFLVQAQMAVADREGGFFVMIGRKRAPEPGARG